MEETREALEFDVLFVGGGPANLAGAIHLMKLAQEKGQEIEICLIDKAEMQDFVQRIGMPGFAPTQGHIPSAVPYLGHAVQAIQEGKIRRAMFLCKSSLFLNRVTELFDGVSFVLERNPGAG